MYIFTFKIIDPPILMHEPLGVHRAEFKNPYITPLWRASRKNCRELNMFNKALSFHYLAKMVSDLNS